MDEGQPSEMDWALLEAVERALEPHGDRSAELTHEWSARAAMWFVETEPVRQGAALFSAAHDGCDRFHVTVAEASIEFSGETVDDLAMVREVASAVFDGRGVLAVRGKLARVTLLDGRRIRLGDAHVPMPWRLRRSHRLATYS